MEGQAYLDRLAEYYKAGGYGPDSVTYPTEASSTEDDPDNIGDGERLGAAGWCRNCKQGI